MSETTPPDPGTKENDPATDRHSPHGYDRSPASSEPVVAESQPAGDADMDDNQEANKVCST